ncbi:hypothetical protein N7462_007237 [Penicillium macrosclerotiorum]|uniref:uncharacterized protein n=1 Tax=Penicillium macrosclerotiorum TaxID=303699 RepID=UPI0025486225|nr:uncharacterized protein N7462_007237 [Penicillium macrosclerotiorum]KAJ5678993.1 hypothetical protein N7462_007237 [Penicillium macrosclerotiorum]
MSWSIDTTLSLISLLITGASSLLNIWNHIARTCFIDPTSHASVAEAPQPPENVDPGALLESGLHGQSTAAAQIESLRAKIKEKEDRVAEYSKQVAGAQRQIENLKSVYAQEASKVSQSAKDISTLQGNLKEKDKTIDMLKSTDSKTKSMLLSEQKKNKDLDDAHSLRGKELKQTKARLEKLESFVVRNSEVDEDTVGKNFSGLWEYATKELYPFIKQDVEMETLKDNSIWERLKKANGQDLPHQVPLLNLNSPAAKYMRLAMVLAVLAREIVQHIFHPVYILSGNHQVCNILSLLAEENSEKESFCRHVFLSVDQNAERDTLLDEARTVVENMSAYISGLLPKSQHDLFCAAIKEITRKAMEFWLPIQRAQQKYEAVFDFSDVVDDDWKPFRFPGENAVPNGQGQKIQDINILTVFPCILLVDDTGREPLTHILQLRSSQELCIAAQQEASRLTTRPTMGRRPTTRSRRDSIAQSTPTPNGKAFLDGSTNKD